MGMSARRMIARAGGPVIEALEQRQLLSTVWQISGTNAADTIILRISPDDPTKVRVTINNVTKPKLLKGLRGIVIDARAGHDDVTLEIPPGLARLKVTVNGWTGNDTITGSLAADELLGGPGNDRISGNAGNDTIDGGYGNDLISGDDGNDNVDSGDGNDSLAGGIGKDYLTGGEGNDQLSGGFSDDVLRGMAGRDTLRGGDGADALFSGEDRQADLVYRDPSDRWKRSASDRQKADERENPLTPLTDTAALKQWAIQQALTRWKWAFGQQVNPWRYWVDLPVAVNDAATSGSAASPDYSQTNTQEDGIDEADIVETDGQFIYLVRDDELIIMDAWPAGQSAIVSRTKLDTWNNQIYLNGGRLTVVSTSYGSYGWGTPLAADARFTSMPVGDWREPTTQVNVFDVANGVPTLVNTAKFDGSLTGSRNIGGRLYLVLDSGMNIPQPLTSTDPETKLEYYESEASYLARIWAIEPLQFLPQYTASSTGVGSASQPAVSPGSLFAPGGTLDTSILTVALIDVTAAQPALVDSAAVMGSGSTMYASAGSVYVARQSWDAPMGMWGGDARTDLYRFGISAAGVDYEGAGHVPGFIINSFAMDEEDDQFRIATTSTEGGMSNNLFVLRDQGASLGIIGSLTDLAFSETIHSVRFMADRAYLVTFRRVDPLFVIDLSNPAKPTVAGELKVPGYSAYLHPAGDGLLIGIGRDADANGRVKGMQASLFDVSDPANPRQINTLALSTMLGGGWQWDGSQAEWDHHAFSYFPEQHLMAVPVTGYSEAGWESRLVLVNVAPTGLSPAGQVTHASNALRSLRIDAFVYSVADDDMKVVPVATPSQIVATVPFTATTPATYGTTATVTGLLRNDFVAIGGDTTGWAIQADSATVEADVSAVAEQAQALAGKQVQASGEYTQIQYTERGLVQVLKVLTLSAV